MTRKRQHSATPHPPSSRRTGEWNTCVYLRNATSNSPPTSGQLPPAFSRCSPHAAAFEFTADSNYTPGRFSFAHLTDILLTSGGVQTLPRHRHGSTFIVLTGSHLHSSSVAASKWGLIAFRWEVCWWSACVSNIRWTATRGGKRGSDAPAWSGEEKSNQCSTLGFSFFSSFLFIIKRWAIIKELLKKVALQRLTTKPEHEKKERKWLSIPDLDETSVF